MNGTEPSSQFNFFLTTKELAGASGSNTSLRVARFFSAGIVPLVIAVAIIVAVKIAEGH